VFGVSLEYSSDPFAHGKGRTVYDAGFGQLGVLGGCRFTRYNMAIVLQVSSKWHANGFVVLQDLTILLRFDPETESSSLLTDPTTGGSLNPRTTQDLAFIFVQLAASNHRSLLKSA
jgi:hypothetical protein